MTTVTDESFLRHMPFQAMRRLAEELNTGNTWEQVAEKIPKKPGTYFGDVNFEPRYTTTNVHSLSEKNQRPRDSAAKAMLVDWGTQNSKIKHLIVILKQCNLWRLVNYLERDVLHKEQVSQAPLINSGQATAERTVCDDGVHSNQFIPRPRQSQQGSQDEQGSLEEPEITFVRNILHEVSISNNEETAAAEDLLQNNDVVDDWAPSDESETDGGTIVADRVSLSSEPNKAQSVEGGVIPEDTDDLTDDPQNLNQIKRISFQILRKITENFDNRHLTEGGRVVGEGGFGSVFLGTFHTGFEVAVKVLRDSHSELTLNQFKTEVETLCNFKHQNIVQLLGYSTEGQNHCLIYQYMPNGSLEERLACRFGTPPLSAAMRLEVFRGTGRAIVYLNSGGVVHRDIKSANILLDAEFNPKLADFATARVLPSGMTNKITTSAVIGTAPYLAPEAINFRIHPKLDSFSFGVVLLETLTALPVIDMKREDADLKYYVKNHCIAEEEGEEPGTIFDLLDSKAGHWDTSVVNTLYSVACQCLEHEQSTRPVVLAVMQRLENIVPSATVNT